MEYNLQTVTFIFTAFLVLWQVGKSLLRIIAPMTASTTDDKVLAAMERSEARIAELEESEWIKNNSFWFWAEVEKLAKNDAPGLKGANKFCQMLGLAHQAWLAAKGKTLSASGVKQLEQIAAGLSASHKIELPLSASPKPVAPDSK